MARAELPMKVIVPADDLVGQQNVRTDGQQRLGRRCRNCAQVVAAPLQSGIHPGRAQNLPHR